jgi:hypothetical protein
MSRYAEQTAVPAERSRGEIESTLRRYGADEFHYGWKGNSAIIAFKAKNRSVRFILPMPDPQAREFTRLRVDSYSSVSDGVREKRYQQACRQRWRALALCIKAKLEAVEAGIVSFDDEFLAHFLLPGGQTIGQKWGAEYAALADAGRLPPLLPGPSH